MTDNVIALPTTQEPADQIWVCGHCGFEAFELHRDGTTECRGCGHRGEYPDGSWTDWTPTKEPPENATRTTAFFGTVEFAQRSIVKSIDENTTILVVARDDGKIRAWSLYDHDSTDAEKATVRYLLAQAASLILGDPPLERPDDALPVDNDDDT